MSPSKLDYLSKYTSSGEVKAGKKSKKKTKSKKKSRSKSEESSKDNARIRDVDGDDEVFGGGQLGGGGSGDEAEDEERPVVVPSEEIPVDMDQLRSTEHRPMGSWKAEGVLVDSHGSKSAPRRGQDGSKDSALPSLEEIRDESRSKYLEIGKARRRYDSDSSDSHRGNQGRRRSRQQQHDSPDSDRASGVNRETTSNRGTTHSESHEQAKRRRYDSSDEDNDVDGNRDERQPIFTKDEPTESLVPPRRRQRRYDSDSDSETERNRRPRLNSSDNDDDRKSNRRNRDGGRSEMKRNTRGSSPTENSYGGEKRKKLVERKGDSSDENKPRQRVRHETDSDGSDGRKRRRRFDSDSGSDDRPVRRSKIKKEEHGERSSYQEKPNRRRYDSDSDSDDDDKNERQKRRHDSDSEDDDDKGKRRNRHDSDSDESHGKGRNRMSSGHTAGLQRADEFTKSEKVLQGKKQKDAEAMVDKYGMGDTVYRDAEGRKTDAPPDGKPKRIKMDPEEQRRLNQSRAQRANAAAQLEEFERLRQSDFARYADDDRLEDDRRNQIRADDPMAAYAQKKMMKKVRKNSSVPLRPMYKGPPAKPNRFGILPGYRWDGVDRANGFEDKILAQRFNKAQKEEVAYRWRSADM